MTNQLVMHKHYTTNNTTPWVTSQENENNQAQLIMIDSNEHLLNTKASMSEVW